MERRVVVRAVIYKDGKVFAVRHKSSPNHWSTPGGGLEDGEDLVYGLKREIIEETGVTPIIDRVLFVQQFYHYGYNNERLEFFFLVKNTNDFLIIDKSQTTHGDYEIEEYAFIDPKTENFLPEFLQDIDFGEYTKKIRPVFLTSSLPKK
jgi:ADP-ribose pyrophosphatase